MKRLILACLFAVGMLAACSGDSVKLDTRVPDKSGIITDRPATLTEGGGGTTEAAKSG